MISCSWSEMTAFCRATSSERDSTTASLARPLDAVDPSMGLPGDADLEGEGEYDGESERRAVVRGENTDDREPAADRTDGDDGETRKGSPPETGIRRGETARAERSDAYPAVTPEGDVRRLRAEEEEEKEEEERREARADSAAVRAARDLATASRAPRSTSRWRASRTALEARISATLYPGEDGDAM